MGTVEQIGVKSTRLRSLDGEQIIVSNAELLKARVHNFGRMYERRVLFTISVRYETPLAVVKEIPAILAGSCASSNACAWIAASSPATATSRYL